MSIYHGRIDYENASQDDAPNTLPDEVETLMNQYYEEHEDNPNQIFPILRKYQGEDAFIFDIPEDWSCTLKKFEKGILRLFHALEQLTQTRIVGGFINVFDIYGVEDGKKTKFIISRKMDASCDPSARSAKMVPETQISKPHMVKSVVDSSKYFAMVKYLKNSTPENLAFYQELTKPSS